MSRLSYTYRGLIVPVLTPFKEDRSLELGIISKYATFLAENGIKGVLVNSRYGEGMSMSVAERKLVTEAWVRAVRKTKQHLMVQIGGAPLPDVIELAEHASSLGVDSILCLPELYYKPTTPEQLIDYLDIVGQAAPETPLLYFHDPKITNVDIRMGQFLELIGDKIPSFVGIKFKSTNYELMEEAQALHVNNRKYVIFLANEELINAAYSLGIDSFILNSANLFPNYILELLATRQMGNMTTANNILVMISNVIVAMSEHDALLQVMKLAMRIFHDIETGSPRIKSKSPSSDTFLATLRNILVLIHALRELRSKFPGANVNGISIKALCFLRRISRERKLYEENRRKEEARNMRDGQEDRNRMENNT